MGVLSLENSRARPESRAEACTAHNARPRRRAPTRGAGGEPGLVPMHARARAPGAPETAAGARPPRQRANRAARRESGFARPPPARVAPPLPSGNGCAAPDAARRPAARRDGTALRPAARAALRPPARCKRRHLLRSSRGTAFPPASATARRYRLQKSWRLARENTNHVPRVQIEPAAMHQIPCSAESFDYLLHRLALGHHADVPQHAPERHGAAHAPFSNNLKSEPFEESAQRAARVENNVPIAIEVAFAPAEQAIHQRVVDWRLDDEESARPQHPRYGPYGAGRIVEMLDHVKHNDGIERRGVIPCVLQGARFHIQAIVRASEVRRPGIGLHAAYAPSLASEAIEEHSCMAAHLEQGFASRQQLAQVQADGFVVRQLAEGTDDARGLQRHGFVGLARCNILNDVRFVSRIGVHQSTVRAADDLMLLRNALGEHDLALACPAVIAFRDAVNHSRSPT